MRSGIIASVILSVMLMSSGTVRSQDDVDELFADQDFGTPADAGELFDEDDDPSPSEEQPYPNTQLPGVDKINQRLEQASDLSKVQELKTKIREEDDETQRQKLADELTKEMQKLFDEDFEKRNDEVKKLEGRVAKLRESLDKRKAARDRIIKNRIESVMLEADGLGLPGETPVSPWANIAGGFAKSFPNSNIPAKPHSVTTVETYPDGSRKVQIQYTETRVEQRDREVPYTVMVPQSRTRMVNGQQQEYMVNVPEQRTRTETYTVAVPVQRERELIVEKGQSAQAAVGNFLRGQSSIEPRFTRHDLPPRQWQTESNGIRSPPFERAQTVEPTNQWRDTAPTFGPIQDQRPRLRTAEPANRPAEN